MRVLALILSVTLVLAGVESRADGLKVGRAAVDITPPPGTPMLTPQRPPYASRPAAEAHDPLRVKAVVLGQGGQKAALVVCDLTSIPVRLIAEARRIIGATTGLDPASV